MRDEIREVFGDGPVFTPVRHTPVDVAAIRKLLDETDCTQVKQGGMSAMLIMGTWRMIVIGLLNEIDDWREKYP